MATSTWCHGNNTFIYNATLWMWRTRAVAAGKLSLMAGTGGWGGAWQQTEAEPVGAAEVWVGGQNVCDFMGGRYDDSL